MKTPLKVFALGLLLYFQLIKAQEPVVISGSASVDPLIQKSSALNKQIGNILNPDQKNKVSQKADSGALQSSSYSPASDLGRLQKVLNEVGILLETNEDPALLLKKYDAALVLAFKMKKLSGKVCNSL